MHLQESLHTPANAGRLRVSPVRPEHFRVYINFFRLLVPFVLLTMLISKNWAALPPGTYPSVLKGIADDAVLFVPRGVHCFD